MFKAQGRRFWAFLVIGIMLGSALGFGGGYLVGATTALGSWSGQWFTEANGNYTTSLKLPFLTAGRVPFVGVGGFLADNAGLQFNSATGTLTPTKLGATTLAGNLAGGGYSATGLTDVNATNVHAGNLYANTATIGGNLYSPEQEATYIFWTSGGATPSTYYCEYTPTGQITTSASAITLLQAAQDSLTKGGSMFLKLGNYTLTNTFNVTNNGVAIYGETHPLRDDHPTDLHPNTQLILGNNVNRALVQVVSYRTDIVLSNLWLNGNYANQGVVTVGVLDLMGGDDCLFENLGVFYGKYMGIRSYMINSKYINIYTSNNVNNGWQESGGDQNIFFNCRSYKNAGSYGWTIVNEWGSSFYGCSVEDNTNYGWDIDTCHDNSFDALWARGNGKDAILLIASTRNSFTGFRYISWSTLISNNAYAAITLISTSTYNTFTGCIIDSLDGSKNIKYGFSEASVNDDYNTYIANIIQGAVTSNIHILGTHSITKDNQGWVTESSGVATIYNTNTTVVINPGMSVTPTTVTVSADFAGAPWVSTITSGTSVTITFTDPTATKHIFWRCSVP
jgi:hypothetical protein